VDRIAVRGDVSGVVPVGDEGVTENQFVLEVHEKLAGPDLGNKVI
jgi:hypothetical protein